MEGMGQVFQNLFPERGLKPQIFLLIQHHMQECFSEPIPRKGTETSVRYKAICKNNCLRFSEPIPRKGTETLLNIILYL